MAARRWWWVNATPRRSLPPSLACSKTPPSRAGLAAPDEHSSRRSSAGERRPRGSTAPTPRRLPSSLWLANTCGFQPMSESDQPKPGLSVFFPAYNDSGTIASLVITALHAARRLTPDCEIIVVNDGSADATADIA